MSAGLFEAAVLALNNIEVVYDNVILVLRGVSLRAEPGRITTLLGANGAGKTTTLKAISGILGPEGDPAGRALARAGATHRRGNLHHHPAAERGAQPHGPDRRAERRPRARHRRPRLRDGERPHRAGRPGRGAAAQLRHQGILSRPQRDRHAQILPRREALQAAYAL